MPLLLRPELRLTHECRFKAFMIYRNGEFCCSHLPLQFHPLAIHMPSDAAPPYAIYSLTNSNVYSCTRVKHIKPCQCMRANAGRNILHYRHARKVHIQTRTKSTSTMCRNAVRRIVRKSIFFFGCCPVINVLVCVCFG